MKVPLCPVNDIINLYTYLFLFLPTDTSGCPMGIERSKQRKSFVLQILRKGPIDSGELFIKEKYMICRLPNFDDFIKKKKV